jgi:monoterpene epsilon-lactone hydrolase
MHAPRFLVRVIARPFYKIGLHHRMPPRIGRRILDFSGRRQWLPRGTVVRKIVLAGRPCERTTVGATDRPRAVLYLHGGGYTVGSPRLFRATAAYLAEASGAVVYNLDYRLAPEHPFPAAWEDAVAAFRELVEVHGYDPGRIAIAGDSAGGGLAAATAITLEQAGLRPGALALFSPWTDPSNDDHELDGDFVTNKAWGRASAALYRRDADRTDPRYAPMYGNLAGLPPTVIHFATTEMLRPEIVRFADRLEQAGVDVEIVAHPRLWHSMQVLAGTLRVATESVQDAGAYLRAHLDADPDAVTGHLDADWALRSAQ